MQPKAEYLFEISWEVCNKVGGIYTVLSSKAEIMKKTYKNYYAIGPLFDGKTSLDFAQLTPPTPFKEVFEELEKENIHCVYGEWKIDGEPKTILVSYSKKVGQADLIKKDLWDKFGIDSLTAAWDFTEPVVWSWCVAKFLEKMRQKLPKAEIVAHFHEWLAGSGILHLKNLNVNMATVFTTHATMLGRAISGSNQELYANLNALNPREEAYKYHVQDKYLTELACAKTADVFTTVSEITGIEAEKILDKKPDMILPNGLGVKEFPTMEEAVLLHRKNRDIMREFITYYFFPYYQFDIEESLIFFMVGRNEFRNKGMDVFIDALGGLNERLKKEKSQKTIISFFFIPDGVREIKNSLLSDREVYNEIKKLVEDESEMMQGRLIRQFLTGERIQPRKLFHKEFVQNIKKRKALLKRDSKNPPLSTHNLTDEANNQVIKAFYTNGLDNSEDDKVKVVFYPIYISEADGLINLKLYDIISGGHMGVFPSYYEPWGLTPVESAALGVPAITSDLSGFGRYINDKSKGGIFVLKRLDKKREEVVADLTDMLYNYSKLRHKQRVEQKLKAKKIADSVTWSSFAKEYVKAHNLALLKKEELINKNA